MTVGLFHVVQKLPSIVHIEELGPNPGMPCTDCPVMGLLCTIYTHVCGQAGQYAARH